MGSPFAILHRRSTQRKAIPGYTTQAAPNNQCTSQSFSTNTQQQLTTYSGYNENDKTDADMISQLVLSAKQGEWRNVWEVLDNKPHLVNCIPSERAWSVLHQAVWHNNVQAVMKILSYPACDSEIRTKQDQTCESGPGKKPVELAKSQRIKDILHSHQEKQVLIDETPTMLPVDRMGHSLGECIHITLACNQGVLIPHKWQTDSNNTFHSIPFIIKTIFGYINIGNNWLNTKSKVSIALQQYFPYLVTNIMKASESTSQEDAKREFFRSVIQFYTNDRFSVWMDINKMLRNQYNMKAGYTPTGLELSICPFALLLNSILVHWNELKGYTGITYRSCCLTQEQAKLYAKGQQFVWVSFSSSSKQKGVFRARSIDDDYDASIYEFVIYNDNCNNERIPKEISLYSDFEFEQECLYPLCSKFEVIKAFGKEIHIRLMN